MINPVFRKILQEFQPNGCYPNRSISALKNAGIPKPGNKKAPCGAFQSLAGFLNGPSAAGVCDRLGRVTAIADASAAAGVSVEI